MKLEDFIILRKNEEIESLKAQLANAIEVIEWYANKQSWNLSNFSDVAREVRSGDCSEVKGFAKYCGGKRAREFLVEIKEKE